MPCTVLENLLVMAPQATAIGILILVAVLGLFLGACAFLIVTGWKIDKRHNAALSRARGTDATGNGALSHRIGLERELGCIFLDDFENMLSSERHFFVFHFVLHQLAARLSIKDSLNMPFDVVTCNILYNTFDRICEAILKLENSKVSRGKTRILFPFLICEKVDHFFAP